MVKVISYCLWGNNPKYNIGAIKNAQLAREIYPDWQARFYCGYSVPKLTIDELLKIGKADICYQEIDSWGMPLKHALELDTYIINAPFPGDWRGMLWRFEAASDPSVNAMISRDCDSRLSLREKLAVDEWMSSDKKWHIMRDHPWHCAPMLGGMWGVKGCSQMTNWIASWRQEDRYQTDQDFLRDIVYPVASKDAMIHAQFCAVEKDTIPFPSRRDGLEFVGQVFDENDIVTAEHQTMLIKAQQMLGEPIRRIELPEHLQ